MSETKHTPGPWSSDGGQYVYSERSASGRMACIAKLFPGEVKGDQGIANARLIAAAPDLLVALQDAIGIVQAAIVNARNRKEYSTIIEGLERREAYMRATIAKATGEEVKL